MKIEGIKLVLGILLFIEPFFFQPKWKWMYGLLWLLAISLIMTKLAVVGYGLFFLINLFFFWKYKQKTVSVGCLSAIGFFLAFSFPEGEKILLLLMLLSVHHEPVLPQLNLPMSVLSYLMDGLFLLLFFLGSPLMSVLLLFLLELYLFFSFGLLNYLYQETDMVYARSLDQIMANYINEVNELYQKIRGWRHDYHNHLQTLNAQLKKHQYEPAQTYLSSLEESLGEIDQIVRSGNTIIDAVVNSKLSLAETKNIPIHVKVFVGNQPIAQEVDLVVILGNLLDNAIEANLEIEDTSQQLLRVYISILQQQLYISVTNARPLTQEISPDYVSTKNDKRGLGIRRINHLVETYHGIVNRQYEEGFFVTEVLLPLEMISS